MTRSSSLRVATSAIAALFASEALRAADPGSAVALRFYGTGVGPPGQQDRVRIPIDDDFAGPDASAPCDVGAAGFTIDFWLRGRLADNATANSGGDNEFFDNRWIDGNIIVDRDIWGGSERDWGVSIAGGLVRFGLGRGDSGGEIDNTVEGNVAVLDNAWHHVACVRDFAAGQISIYVDGVLDFAGSANINQADLSYPNAGAPGAQTAWGPFIVLAAEKHDAGAAYPSFNGYFDEFRVWSGALSGTQIAAVFDRVIPANTAALVGYYRFEEGLGTTIADSSAAGSPSGLLIAGVPGNGEWVRAATDPLNVAPVSADCLNQPCDANCDGAVSVGDIGAFVLAISGGQAAWEAAYSCDFLCATDVNNDGSVTVGDIGEFVQCLTGG